MTLSLIQAPALMPAALVLPQPRFPPFRDVDFLRHARLPSDFAYSGGDNGTSFDNQRVLRTLGTDEARFDHNPVTGAPLGPWMEQERETILLENEDFGTTWTATQITLSTNSLAAPDGAITADGLIASTATNLAHFVRQTLTVDDDTTYKVSVYAQKGGKDWITLRTVDKANNGEATYFDLTNGVVGARDDTGTGAIEDIGGGLYRISVTFTSDSGGTTPILEIYIAEGNSDVNYTGDGSTIELSLWGGNTTPGDLSSYIKATTAAVTRTADLLTLPFVPGDEGTIYFEYSTDITPANDTFTRILEISDGSNNNVLSLREVGGNTVLNIRSGNVEQGSISAGAWLTGTNKLAFSFKENKMVFVANGVVAGEDTAALMPVGLSEIGFGSVTYAAKELNGHLRRFKQWWPVLPAQEMQGETVV